jgi:outer membrane protein OmpU
LKKFLFSTTALAVAGAFAFSGDANAAAKPISIGVGGFMNSEIGVGTNQSAFEAATDGSLTKTDSFNTVQDSEIYFTGTTKLDSGVSVSVTVQLEADQTGGIIDESYMKLTGGFGDLRLGYVTGAASTLKHTAPFVGMNLTFGGTENYVTAPAAITTNNSTHVSSSGDAAKISYISPRTGGLAIGVAYTPSTTASNLSPAIGGLVGTETQVYEAALSFENTVGTTSIKADVEYEHSTGTSNNTHDMVRGGVSISAGGFTVGGSLSQKKNYGTNTKDNTTNTDEISAYDLGVSYAMGDWTVGIAGASGEADTAIGGTDSESKWSVGAAYGGLGGGVTLTATYVNVDYSDATATAANNNSGHAMIGQIKVAF